MHLNIKKGDGKRIEMLIILVANRIVTVGDSKRAWKISRFFDNPDTTINVFSTRIFKTYTGTFKGVPITVVTTGMGVPMIDFVIREIREVVEGPMAVVRLGTCGIMNLSCTAGDIVVASKGAIFI